eukprot:5479675-Prymnesium_polylepis.1
MGGGGEGGGADGSGGGGGGLGGNLSREPQSLQSEPKWQLVKSAPGPPSSQKPSNANAHES